MVLTRSMKNNVHSVSDEIQKISSKKIEKKSKNNKDENKNKNNSSMNNENVFKYVAGGNTFERHEFDKETSLAIERFEKRIVKTYLKKLLDFGPKQEDINEWIYFLKNQRHPPSVERIEKRVGFCDCCNDYRTISKIVLVDGETLECGKTCANKLFTAAQFCYDFSQIFGNFQNEVGEIIEIFHGNLASN